MIGSHAAYAEKIDTSSSKKLIVLLSSNVKNCACSYSSYEFLSNTAPIGFPSQKVNKF